MRVPALAAIALASALLAGCTPTSTPIVPAPGEARDAGVQLFQWNWDSIAHECTEVLGPAGIAWVLTSPPQEHILGEEWWTAYQPVSYLVESRLGTREQFAAMTATCAEAGVEVIADAVINHMTGQDAPGTGWAGSPYEHYAYPGIYDDADFHHCGLTAGDDIQNYKDAQQVRECELVNLADLATGTPKVQDTIVAYLADLLDLGAAGFRIDAAKHMPPEDVAAIIERLPEGTRIMHEVIRGAGEPIAPEDYLGSGQVFEFAFARETREKVETGRLDLGDFQPVLSELDSSEAIVFVANHDTERNGETASPMHGMPYLLSELYLLAQPWGTPVLYSGYAFANRDAGPPQDADGRVLDVETCTFGGFDDGDWLCAHRQPEILGMLQWRSAVGDDPVVDRWTDRKGGFAFGRGERGFVAFNAGEFTLEHTFQTSLAPGVYRDVVNGETVKVAADGTFTAELLPLHALAIHVGARE